MMHSTLRSKTGALGATLGLGLALAITGCTRGGGEGGSKPGGGAPSTATKSIQNRGSDTMIELAQAWAEEYHDASVEVAGGGSGVGASSLVAGTVQIGNLSRSMSADEIAQATAKSGGKTPISHTVGYDALAIYVHKDNPLDEITVEQLKEIFGDGGKILKWADLGVSVPGCEGDKDKIVVASRQNNSGTYEYFKEAVLGKGGKYRLGTIDLNGSRDLVKTVETTPCAIGYSGMGYKTPGVKFLKIKNKDGVGVLPSVPAVHDGSYPISRPLYMYTIGEGEEHVQKYIRWVKSDAGQDILENIGYVPLKPEERTKAGVK